MEAHLASTEREPIMGVWEQSPQRGTVAEPLVKESGGVKSPPLKLKAFCLSEVPVRRKLICPFCYPVNCSSILFERILLHLCLESFYLSATKSGGGA